MSEIFDGITLVVPVKDRPDYFSRLLSHLEYCESPYEIHVGDGSLEGSNAAKYKEFCRQSPLPIAYTRYRPDRSVPDFLSKMHMMASKVETDMVYFLSDDDFVILPTLQLLSAEMAQANASAAMGMVLDFHIGSSQSKVAGGMAFSQSDIDCGGRYSTRSAITHQFPADRIREADRFFPWEALMRSSVLKDATESCHRSGAFSTRHLHWAVQFQALISGPVLSSDKLLLMRQDDTDHHAGSLIAEGGADSWTTVFDSGFQRTTRECLSGLNFPDGASLAREEVAWQYGDMLRRRGRLLLRQDSGPKSELRRLGRAALRRAAVARSRRRQSTDADLRAGAQAALQQLDELDLDLDLESRRCARAAVRATASAKVST